MNVRLAVTHFSIVCVCLALITANSVAQLDLPYAEVGLSDRQAAVHLLERFGYGARPGDVDRVVEMGLSVWLEQQFTGNLPAPEVETRLAGFKALSMPAREIVETYPRPNIVRGQAQREGIISRDETMEPAEMRKKMLVFAKEKGYRPLNELTQELQGQKLIRAVYSENQLTEVLTDFWFNHFNVSTRDNQARAWVLSYERDAIRPHVLGRFREMLGATAKHPAMLYYLDNAQSTAPQNQPINARNRKRQQSSEQMEMQMEAPPPKRPRRGINENYARELLELHTLGVDGGYTQKDVVEVARAFTGWSIYPSERAGERIDRQMKRRPNAFVREGEFLYKAWAHDKGEKTILGQQFQARGGVEEGERVLDIVAEHPSTARHIAHKLAVRFVADNPPETLVDRLSQTFLDTDGDILAMIQAIAASPEFWKSAKQRSKMKTPFEFTVSALRAVDADLKNPRPTVQWIARMGQPLYACLPPTGYPDRAEAWINTGALLNRMNFGISLAAGKIRGVRLNLPALKKDDASTNSPLETYTALLLPERDLTETIQKLTPLVQSDDDAKLRKGKNRKRERDIAARVVGFTIGSPEFQRR